ncbi:hypothetical protein ACW5WQ_21080 [Aeromonas rivuli]|uniref:hypothetical protein n=1 Tax=Aeromonas rivuli TaxID=648794 RepID=UPI0012ECCA96|nr:hypothetical protein [Aeromonas rivuli]
MKKTMKILCVMFLPCTLVACSVANKELSYSYEQVKSMPGYGYINLDFSKSNQIDYGRRWVPGKTNYVIHYTNSHGSSLFVDVKDADFEGRMLKAYIPYQTGYNIHSVMKSFFHPFYRCKKCDNEPVLTFVYIYAIYSVSEARCADAIYKNLQEYDAMVGCPGMGGIEEYKKVIGSVFVTPHFHSDFGGMFTSYDKPIWGTAGS